MYAHHDMCSGIHVWMYACVKCLYALLYEQWHVCMVCMYMCHACMHHCMCGMHACMYGVYSCMICAAACMHGNLCSVQRMYVCSGMHALHMYVCMYVCMYMVHTWDA